LAKRRADSCTTDPDAISIPVSEPGPNGNSWANCPTDLRTYTSTDRVALSGVDTAADSRPDVVPDIFKAVNCTDLPTDPGVHAHSNDCTNFGAVINSGADVGTDVTADERPNDSADFSATDFYTECSSDVDTIIDPDRTDPDVSASIC
jgi:hypothetical protein